MKVRDVMTKQVVRIGAQEPVEVAARTLTHYNLGALPVCGADGRVCGMVTDRDVVTRCVAAGRNPGIAKVRDVMTGRVISVQPDMDVAEAAQQMGEHQLRRLPVVEAGRLCGMVTLCDLAERAKEETNVADTLGRISANITKK